jgi:hypothetical protein
MPCPPKKGVDGLNHFRTGDELPVVRHLIRARRAGVVTGVVAGLLLVAGPALADVSVSPTSAAQGSGQNLNFTVTNPDPRAITKVTLVLPPDTPIAEVYPLSVDDWAPRITLRTLSTPLATIHGGSPVTEATQEITWIAMPGKSIPTGKSAALGIAIGPLPALSQMRFSFVPTYADGTNGTSMPASLALTPAAAGQAPPGHTGGHPSATAAPDPNEDTYFRNLTQDTGPGFWGIAGWVIAGLGLAGVLVALLRGRRKGAAVEATDDDTSAPDVPKEPVGASAARSRAWRYRDGPDEE